MTHMTIVFVVVVLVVAFAAPAVSSSTTQRDFCNAQTYVVLVPVVVFDIAATRRSVGPLNN